MAFKTRFKKQEVKEEDIVDEEVFDEEEDEEEIEVPRPSYKKTVQQPSTERIEPQPIQKEEPLWRMEEVPTQTSPVIYNSKTKKFYTLYDAIAEILNRTE